MYKEIARQIVEFISIYDKPQYEKFEKIKQTRSPKEARQLIKQILASRMCCESGETDLLRNIILIIMREELSNSIVFDFFFEKAFKPISDMMTELVEIGSKGRYTGESARIAAKMLMGQVLLFNNARTGVMRSLGWKVFDEVSAQKVAKINSDFVDKVLL